MQCFDLSAEYIFLLRIGVDDAPPRQLRQPVRLGRAIRLGGGDAGVHGTSCYRPRSSCNERALSHPDMLGASTAGCQKFGQRGGLASYFAKWTALSF